jgi:outer membrane protein assembly factor BamD (BamD/ComL family)
MKGLALLEMNRTADAVIQFQHVVTAYPKSEEARVARERLRALGLRER